MVAATTAPPPSLHLQALMSVLPVYRIAKNGFAISIRHIYRYTLHNRPGEPIWLRRALRNEPNTISQYGAGATLDSHCIHTYNIRMNIFLLFFPHFLLSIFFLLARTALAGVSPTLSDMWNAARVRLTLSSERLLQRVVFYDVYSDDGNRYGISGITWMK